MAGQLSSVGFIKGCGGALAFGMTPVAITPTAHNISGEGKMMHSATKRTLIAAAALTAAGLFGSLPYHGSTQASPGVPTVHHDIALVDTASDILTLETGLDDQVYASIFGSTGAEASLYNSFVDAFGANNAQILLDTNTAEPVYSGVINGAVSRFSDSLLYDTWAGESEINALFGVDPSVSDAAILADINADFVPLPTGFELPDAGDPNFAADLLAIANADLTTGYSDLLGYFADVSANLGNLDLSDLGGLSGLIGDLSGGDLSAVLSGLLGDLTGGLDPGSILGGLGL
jgi:hypothetical protein